MERTGFERLCAEHDANVVRTAYLIIVNDTVS